MSRGPLSGVRVADFSRLLPGAYCTWLLASLGADVVKVEQPGKGDYQRDLGVQAGQRGGAVFQHVNRGKRSLTLDLKDSGAAEVVDRLTGWADIVVESFRPGVAARLGLDFAALRARRPALVCLSISGFGAVSPMAQVAAHDLNYLAFSGALARPLAEGDGLPEIPWVDLIGGGLTPALGAIALLTQARATGQGGILDAAMADALPLLPNEILAAAALGQPEPDADKMPFSGRAANYTTYRLKDGHVAVGAVEPQFLAAFCGVMGLDPDAPDLRDQAARAFARMTRADVEARFDGIDACVTLVNDYGEMLTSDHARMREFLRPVEGEMPEIGSPFVIDGARVFASGAAPLAGEQGTDILSDLGYTPAEIRALRDEGVVGAEVSIHG